MSRASNGATANFEEERASESHAVKNKQRNSSKGVGIIPPAFLESESKRKRLDDAEDCLDMLKLDSGSRSDDDREGSVSMLSLESDCSDDDQLPNNGAEFDSDDSSEETEKSDTDSLPSLASDSDSSSDGEGTVDLDSYCSNSDHSSDDIDREDMERNRRSISDRAAAGLATFFPLVMRPMFEENRGFLLTIIQQFLMHHPEMATDNSPPRALPATIESLPEVKITRKEADSNLTCCICRCDFEVEEDVLQLPCTHKYHAPCIKTWLEMHATCPTCRDILPH